MKKIGNSEIMYRCTAKFQRRKMYKMNVIYSEVLSVLCKKKNHPVYTYPHTFVYETLISFCYHSFKQ